MKKNPEKSLWGGGFHRRLVGRKSAAGHTRLTRKSRVSATKIKILRKTEHMSKIMVYWGCLPIFLTIQPHLAAGWPKNQKMPFSSACRPAVNMPAAFCSFLALIVSQVHRNAGMLKIKGQFKVSCKKLGQNRILVTKIGGCANLHTPDLIRLAESPT